jgi:hypothetical protein
MRITVQPCLIAATRSPLSAITAICERHDPLDHCLLDLRCHLWWFLELFLGATCLKHSLRKLEEWSIRRYNLCNQSGFQYCSWPSGIANKHWLSHAAPQRWLSCYFFIFCLKYFWFFASRSRHLPYHLISRMKREIVYLPKVNDTISDIKLIKGKYLKINPESFPSCWDGLLNILHFTREQTTTVIKSQTTYFHCIWLKSDWGTLVFELQWIIAYSDRPQI